MDDETSELLAEKDREIAALQARVDELLNRVRHFEALERDRAAREHPGSYINNLAQRPLS